MAHAFRRRIDDRQLGPVLRVPYCKDCQAPIQREFESASRVLSCMCGERCRQLASGLLVIAARDRDHSW